jgi:hypothetical protein
MKEYFLDCDCDNSLVCNTRIFILFSNNDFYFITIPTCKIRLNENDVILEIVSKLFNNYKVTENYEINKSINVDLELKKNRLKNVYKKSIQQVNFLYGSGNKYAITTNTPFFERYFNNQLIEDNYIRAKQYLIKKDMEFKLKDLDNLYNANHIKFYNESEIEICRGIDEIVNKINKKTNGNNQKSKFKRVA